MTVQEVIDYLAPIKDKTRTVYLDCPHCGRSNEIAAVTSVVLISAKRKDGDA